MSRRSATPDRSASTRRVTGTSDASAARPVSARLVHPSASQRAIAEPSGEGMGALLHRRVVLKGGGGPERFFYDRSTYTGVHKNGGPSTVDILPW